MTGDVLDERSLRDLILARRASFAVGVSGVLAEFHWAPDDDVALDDGALGIATARGGIRIRTGLGERLAVVPGPAAADHAAIRGAGGARLYWLPDADAGVWHAHGLAELGADSGALRPGDRDGVLFDLGFGLGHVQACVRTADPALIATLRGHRGEDLLAHRHPAMSAIKAHGPHRVFRSRMARIEVYQPIPSRARGERTPAGPHTHVLPALLGRPDSALATLPARARVVLAIHPADHH